MIWVKYHLYKHLLYIDFLSFNRQLWSCYLKDTASFFQHWAGLAANSCNVFIILKWIHGKFTNSEEELDFSWGTGSPYCMVMLMFSIYIKHITCKIDFIFSKQKISCSKYWNLIKLKLWACRICNFANLLNF